MAIDLKAPPVLELPTPPPLAGEVGCSVPALRALHDQWVNKPPRPKPRGDRIRARAILVQTLVGFALVQVALGTWLLTQGAGWRDPVFHDRVARLQAKILSHPDRAVVLVLGSSRLLNGLNEVDAEQASEALGKPIHVGCFAYPGAGPLTQRLILSRVLAAGVRPDLVVVEALPALLHDDPKLEFEASRVPTRTLRGDELELVQTFAPADRPDVSLDYWANWLCPASSQRFALVNQLCPVLLPLHLRVDYGPEYWTPAYMNARNEEGRRYHRAQLIAKAQESFAPGIFHFQADNPGCAALFDLLDQCRRQRLSTLVVFMPEGPIFQSWYSDQSRRESAELMRRIEQDQKHPVIQARDWLPDEAYFTDSHHLLEHGAAEFTRRFLREGILPVLGRRDHDGDGGEFSPKGGRP